MYLLRPLPRSLLPLVCIASFVYPLLTSPALGQSLIVPDDSLGEERSQIIPNFNGLPVEVIEGGARRGPNLFHSFEEFNVDDDRGAYFASPAGLNHIFSRVTGNNASTILGILGTFGASTPDLFFMNPNGVLLGPNAFLDLKGSFTVTTADGIEFGNGEVFGAIAPTVPSPRLNVDPSAYLFSQTPNGNITVQSDITQGIEPQQRLTFLGGDILFDGTLISLRDVDLFIGGLVGAGQVTIEPDASLSILSEDNLSEGRITDGLIFIEDNGDIQVQTGDFILDNTFIISGTFSAENAGDIEIQSDSIEIVNNSSISSINSANSTGSTGNILIDSEILTLDNDARITIFSSNQEEGGNIVIHAEDQLYLSTDATITTGTFATGKSGDIVIETGQLRIESTELGENQPVFIASQTFGEGEGGSIHIQADTSVEIAGPNSSISTSSASGEAVNGNLGDISINTRTLTLSDGAQISTSVFGSGKGGSLTIRATDSVNILNRSTSPSTSQNITSNDTTTTIASSVYGPGTGGSIVIDTRVLNISADSVENGSENGSENGGVIVNRAASINTRTEGNGDSGSIEITAQDAIQLDSGTISATTRSNGEAGDITIETRHLSLLNNASIANDTGDLADDLESTATGNAGNIFIRATESIELARSDLFPAFFPPQISSQTLLGSEGEGGNITIETDRLRVRDGGKISTETSSSPSSAGDITIQARDVEIVGWTLDIDNPEFRSQISAGVSATRPGVEGGTVTIDTERLSLRDGGFVSVSTFGNSNEQLFGISGDLVIRATDFIDIDGTTGPNNSAGDQFVSTLSAELQNAKGQGGSIVVEAGAIRLRNGGRIEASTFSDGDAGDISIQAEQLHIGGFSRNGRDTGIAAFVGEVGKGNAGDIDVTVDQLRLSDGGRIATFTSGDGDAGRLQIHAEDITLLGENQPPLISSQVLETAIGNGGDVRIQSDRLLLRNGGQISASTLGQGNAGNVTVRAGEIRLIGATGNFASEISSGVFLGATGNAGNQLIQADRLIIRGGAGVVTTTLSEGRAGDIIVRAGDILLQGFNPVGITEESGAGSGIFALVAPGATGRGGDIQIQANRLDILDGGVISALTAGGGRAGTIDLEVGDRVYINGVNPSFGSPIAISARTLEDADGRAGDITISTDEFFIGNGATINAQTLNDFRSGNITINATTFEAIDGGQIISSTAGGGQAGNITVNITDTIRLAGRDVNYSDRLDEFGETVTNEGSGESGIFANARQNSRGDSGSITANAATVVIQDGATISSQSEGAGNAGTITVNVAQNLEMGDRAQITSSTFGQGDAGNITIRATDDLVLSNSAIASEVTDTATGGGGDITIQAGTVRMDDRASITAQSNAPANQTAPNRSRTLPHSPTRTLPHSPTPNTPNAGNITITIDNILFMDDSDITTQAAAFAGGEIEIRAADIRLQGDSDISTNVSSGSAGGGNITLTASSILAFDDSDILAFAADGRGGNILLDTDAFFGDGFTLASLEADPIGLDGNDRVDVNATGTFSGTVSLPDVNNLQNSLNALPARLINTERLITHSCVARNEDGSSTYVITGNGGLRHRPGASSLSHYATGDVQNVPASTSTSQLPHSPTPPLPTSPTRWQPGDPIIEPQGVYQLPSGELILSHACR